MGAAKFQAEKALLPWQITGHVLLSSANSILCDVQINGYLPAWDCKPLLDPTNAWLLGHVVIKSNCGESMIDTGRNWRKRIANGNTGGEWYFGGSGITRSPGLARAMASHSVVVFSWRTALIEALRHSFRLLIHTRHWPPKHEFNYLTRRNLENPRLSGDRESEFWARNRAILENILFFSTGRFDSGRHGQISCVLCVVWVAF